MTFSSFRVFESHRKCAINCNSSISSHFRSISHRALDDWGLGVATELPRVCKARVFRNCSPKVDCVSLPILHQRPTQKMWCGRPNLNVPLLVHIQWGINYYQYSKKFSLLIWCFSWVYVSKTVMPEISDPACIFNSSSREVLLSRSLLEGTCRDPQGRSPAAPSGFCKLPSLLWYSSKRLGGLKQNLPQPNQYHPLWFPRSLRFHLFLPSHFVGPPSYPYPNPFKFQGSSLY